MWSVLCLFLGKLWVCFRSVFLIGSSDFAVFVIYFSFGNIFRKKANISSFKENNFLSNKFLKYSSLDQFPPINWTVSNAS